MFMLCMIINTIKIPFRVNLLENLKRKLLFILINYKIGCPIIMDTEMFYG